MKYKKIILFLLILSFYLPGKIGQALSFDGVNDYVNVGAPHYVAGGQITVSAWVNGAAGIDGNVYAEGNTTDTGIRFAISRGFVTNTKVHIVIRDGTSAFLNTDNTLTVFNSAWHHIAFTDNNGTAAFYVDGVRDSTSMNYTPTAITLDTASIGIYRRATLISPYPGKIDDVRVYNRALSANEIRMIYYGFGTRTGLVGYWRLLGASLPFEPDFSGYGNHGTATNGPIRGALSKALRFRR